MRCYTANKDFIRPFCCHAAALCQECRWACWSQCQPSQQFGPWQQQWQQQQWICREWRSPKKGLVGPAGSPTCSEKMNVPERIQAVPWPDICKTPKLADWPWASCMNNSKFVHQKLSKNACRSWTFQQGKTDCTRETRPNPWPARKASNESELEAFKNSDIHEIGFIGHPDWNLLAIAFPHQTMPATWNG